jgi:YVTN family beta-propeller protein
MLVLGLALALCAPGLAQVPTGSAVPDGTARVATVPGMPPVPDPKNLYSEQTAGKLSATVAGDLPRVYVPHVQSSDVYVIDPATFKVVKRFNVGLNPQHVVPSWDLKTLWVANNAERRTVGSLTPIDPKTGKPGAAMQVDDPYNMYFTPDGKAAIVVAESFKRLDFRDPHSMTLQSSLAIPQCDGLNHADFSIDGRYAIFTCEFTVPSPRSILSRQGPELPPAYQARLPTRSSRLRWRDELSAQWKGMPGHPHLAGRRLFFVADVAGGVFVVDAGVPANRLRRPGGHGLCEPR